MNKITFDELCELFEEHNEKNRIDGNLNGDKALVGVVVFSSDNWKEDYSLESRSYVISSKAKFFNPNMIGKSLYSTNLDKTDRMVRLDYYLNYWKIDYCYIK